MVAYVATQQEPLPPLLPFVVPRGSPTTEKDEIWLLWKRAELLFGNGVHGCESSGPVPLSQPGYGPTVALKSWNRDSALCWKVKELLPDATANPE